MVKGTGEGGAKGAKGTGASFLKERLEQEIMCARRAAIPEAGLSVRSRFADK
jgi:hypothetical protein